MDRQSTGGIIVSNFGLGSDIPAPADFDGDGKADLAVWRSGTTAAFYVLKTTNGATQTQNHGTTGDIPVPGDYDGDGKTDFAVRHGNDWVIKQSSDGSTNTVVGWYLSTDIEVQNDYDGDGKTDIAVWRPSDGNQYRYFMYDSLGRVLYAREVERDANSNFSGSSYTDPLTSNNQWSTKYEYDDNGNIIKTTDAKNEYIVGTYDNFNRLTYRNYSDSTPDVTFYYDGTGLGGSAPSYSKGKTVRVASSVSETRFTSFDAMGRLLTSEQRTTAGQFAGTEAPYDFTYTYNLSGALIEEAYPSGRVVKNTLNEDGELSQVQSKKTSNAGFWAYASGFNYDAAGAVTKMQLGNGHWETASYNERQQVTMIGLGLTDSTQDLLKLEFNYTTTSGHDNNGSLREQKITVPTVGNYTGFTATQTYSYDAINRLQSAEEKISGSTTWKQTFDYDRYGNRSFNVSGTNTTTIPSGCSTAICNPTFSATTNRISSSGYTYDANGALTQNATGQRFGYDAENVRRNSMGLLTVAVRQTLFTHTTVMETA